MDSGTRGARSSWRALPRRCGAGRHARLGCKEAPRHGRARSPEVTGSGSMPKRSIAQFAVDYTQYLAPDGRALGPLPSFAEDAANLVPLYRSMVLTRAFDAKAIALQRTGRLGTFASSLGQEAVGVGAASAMRADDVLVPSFRDQAAQLWRGVTPLELLLYWG